MSLAVFLENIVHRFWQVEEPDVSPDTFTTDGQYEAFYTNERTCDSTERFVVPLPFLKKHRDETPRLQIALRRFQNLERKLQTDEVLGQAYRQFMQEYESLGYMSKNLLHTASSGI